MICMTEMVELSKGKSFSYFVPEHGHTYNYYYIII